MSTLGGSVSAVPGRLLGVNPVNHPGGAETTLLRLLRGLSACGWRVTASTPGGGPLADAVVHAGLDWEPLPTGGLGRGQGARALAAWPRLRRLAADVDVVLLNGTVTGRLLPALLWSGTLGVLDVNDMVTRVPRLWRLADLILADSEAIATRLRALDPQLDPLVVGLPVDLDPPTTPAPWPHGDGAGPVIGFVGRLEPRKGLHDLLGAVPLVRAGAADARFVIVGDDPYGSDPDYTSGLLADAERLGVTHIPWHDNAPGLMRHMDVLVLPSSVEPFGTVLAEAMAVGTPVVATRVDGLVEVVEDGVSGRLVPAHAPGALAAAVLEVLTRRGEMSAAARERGRRWDAVGYVERISALFEARIASPR